MTELEERSEKRSGSRDKIVELLIRRAETVESLASVLGITHNAVRAQIALLHREGIVEVQGEKKGTRRPAAVYSIKPGAEVRPSRAYPVVLAHLVQVLSKRLDDADFTAVMKEVGSSVAKTVPRNSGNPRERVEAALALLKSLGSSAHAIEDNGTIVLNSHGCPLSAAVSADKRSCLAMEVLLKKITGLPVRESCHHGQHPQCRFVIRMPKES